MADSKNWFSSMFSSEPGPNDIISSTPMNATKIVSIFVFATAIIGQVLENFDAFGIGRLSPTLTVVMWLGVGFLIVSIVVTDMIVRAYTTAHSQGFKEKSFEEPISVDVLADGSGIKGAQWRGWVDEPGAILARIRYNDDREDTWVPLTKIRQHP